MANKFGAMLLSTLKKKNVDVETDKSEFFLFHIESIPNLIPLDLCTDTRNTSVVHIVFYCIITSSLRGVIRQHEMESMEIIIIIYLFIF